MPWTTVSIFWPAIIAALLPLDLTSLIDRWPQIFTRLAALNVIDKTIPQKDRSRPRQVERFRKQFECQIQTAA